MIASEEKFVKINLRLGNNDHKFYYLTLPNLCQMIFLTFFKHTLMLMNVCELKRLMVCCGGWNVAIIWAMLRLISAHQFHGPILRITNFCIHKDTPLDFQDFHLDPVHGREIKLGTIAKAIFSETQNIYEQNNWQGYPFENSYSLNYPRLA